MAWCAISSDVQTMPSASGVGGTVGIGVGAVAGVGTMGAGVGAVAAGHGQGTGGMDCEIGSWD